MPEPPVELERAASPNRVIEPVVVVIVAWLVLVTPSPKRTALMEALEAASAPTRPVRLTLPLVLVIEEV